MTLGLYETRARQKRRARWAAVKWFFFLVVMGVVAVFAYGSGVRQEEHSRAALVQEIGMLSDRVAAVEGERTRLQAELKEARAEAAKLEARYANDVPSGPLAEILQLARAKMNEGMSPDRIAFLLGGRELAKAGAAPAQQATPQAAESPQPAETPQAASEPQATETLEAAVVPAGTCVGKPVTKRFLVETPISSAGENGYVRFVDGAITVTGEGVSALTGDGRPEAWYDPEKPITLRFVEKDGRVSEMTGLLPLRQVVRSGNQDFSFEVMPGARGFVQVTSWDCGVQ